MVGDSQLRHLAGAMHDVVQEHRQYLFLSQDALNSTTDKRIQTSEFIHFTYDNWGLCFINRNCDVAAMNHCSAVLFNFGHWAAGWPKGYAWSASRYAQEVQAALNGARKLFPKKRLIWITNHPHGETRSISTTPPEDWRNDMVLHSYNDAALRILKELDFEHVDIFRVANVLHDLTYDGAHYKGAVERELARITLHTLCRSLY